MVKEEDAIRKFVVSELLQCSDLSSLTLGIIRKRYLEQVGRESLSIKDRQLMKTVVEEELLKMQDSSDDEPLAKLVERKRKRLSDDGNEDLEKERTKRSRHEESLPDSPDSGIEKAMNDEGQKDEEAESDKNTNEGSKEEKQSAGKKVKQQKQQIKEKDDNKMKKKQKKREKIIESEEEDELEDSDEDEEKIKSKREKVKKDSSSEEKSKNSSKSTNDSSEDESGPQKKKMQKKRQSIKKKKQVEIDAVKEVERQVFGSSSESEEEKTDTTKTKMSSDSESEKNSDGEDLDTNNEKTKEEEEQKEDVDEDSDSSSLPSLDDEDEQPKGKKEEKQKSVPKKKRSEEKEKASSEKDEKNKTLARLKRYISLCGVRRNYKKLLGNCRSMKAKVAVLKKELEDLGVEGKPSIDKCKKARLKREEAQEVAELDVSNIITTQGRPQRRAARAWPPPLNVSTPSAYKRVVDSDSDSEDSHTNRGRKKPWGNLQGIISDDGESD